MEAAMHCEATSSCIVNHVTIQHEKVPLPLVEILIYVQSD